LYYYAIKPKQPLGGDTAACVLKDCVILQHVVGRFLAHWRQTCDINRNRCDVQKIVKFQQYATRKSGPPGIPVLKVENSPLAPCKNSRKFPLSNTPLYTLSANINLTNSHHLSIAMSNIAFNSTVHFQAAKSSISKQILQTQTAVFEL